MILAALNSDYDKLIGILRFELPQLREYMDAVDSPIGPEVEKEDLSSQVGETKLSPASVNPVEIVGKIGCPDSRSRSEFSRHLMMPLYRLNAVICMFCAIPEFISDMTVVVCARKLLQTRTEPLYRSSLSWLQPGSRHAVVRRVGEKLALAAAGEKPRHEDQRLVSPALGACGVRRGRAQAERDRHARAQHAKRPQENPRQSVVAPRAKADRNVARQPASPADGSLRFPAVRLSHAQHQVSPSVQSQ